jgi:antagonist of KipI
MSARMNAIEVLEPGLLTTVQDLGREGFGAMGVSASGAADGLSLRVGNKLLGNAEGAAGLEMTLLGGTFLFRDGASIVLAGSDFGATLDGNAVEMWAVLKVRSGQKLRVSSTHAGARCYLCVRGGIAVPEFLGSASTHILSGLGGHEGRGLKKEDGLAIGEAVVGRGGRGLSERGRKMLLPGKTLRATPGPQSDWFAGAAQELFFASTYCVTEDANRMGLRLAGPAIARAAERELISEGVALGAVQVPESGMPIILFVEQQTTGGYPKIANVIAADFHSLGQLRPRDEIRFELVSWDEARAAFLEQEKLMASEELLFV